MRSHFVLLVALGFGLTLRLVCLDAELWLDEIWSLDLARQAGSLLGVFTLRHDNNHPLNTLWLVLCPDDAAAGWYRLHTFAAGVATILAGWVAGRRYGEEEGGFAAFLLAGCSWLVFAAAEARGYAFAVLFAVVAFDALGRYLDGRETRWLCGFWLATILGFLAHLTFALPYVAFIVWSLRRFGEERTQRSEIRSLLVCHAGPALFFVPFYLLCVRGTTIGGGPSVSVWEVLTRLIAMGMGGASTLPMALPWLLGWGVLALVGWRAVRASTLKLFFAVAVVGAPAVFLLAGQALVYERYLLLPWVFSLLQMAFGLAWLWRGAGWRKLLAIAVVIAFLIGNFAQVARYSQTGRGRLTEALTWILDHSSSPEVVVSGDHDFRVRLCVEFHGPRVASARRFVYREGGSEAGAPEWLLHHRTQVWLEPRPEPDLVIQVAGKSYRLVWSAPAAGPLDWGWFVYRRDP